MCTLHRVKTICISTILVMIIPINCFSLLVLLLCCFSPLKIGLTWGHWEEGCAGVVSFLYESDAGVVREVKWWDVMWNGRWGWECIYVWDGLQNEILYYYRYTCTLRMQTTTILIGSLEPLIFLFPPKLMVLTMWKVLMARGGGVNSLLKISTTTLSKPVRQIWGEASIALAY